VRVVFFLNPLYFYKVHLSRWRFARGNSTRSCYASSSLLPLVVQPLEKPCAKNYLRVEFRLRFCALASSNLASSETWICEGSFARNHRRCHEQVVRAAQVLGALRTTRCRGLNGEKYTLPEEILLVESSWCFVNNCYLTRRLLEYSETSHSRASRPTCSPRRIREYSNRYEHCKQYRSRCEQ